MDAAKYMCSSKHLKRKKITIALQITQKSASKGFIITFPTFFQEFFCNIFQTDLIQMINNSSIFLHH